MLRRPLRLAGVALAIFALAACQFSIGPITFDPVLSGTHTAQVSTSPSALRTNVQIAPGETLVYRIDMPAGVRDLLYGEAVGSGLRVGWLSSAGATLAVSESRHFFAGSVGALATADAAIEVLDTIGPRAIDVPYVCVGPCAAIAPPASGHRYLAVRNVSTGPRSFSLYAYTMWANDLEDRGSASNDTLDTATPFGAGEVLIGAIELLGDRDWFRYTGSGDRLLTFTVTEGSESVGLRLRILNGPVLNSGQTETLYPGDRFEVFSELGRAGPAGSARYIIENDPF
jgi:hypothetical protein